MLAPISSRPGMGLAVQRQAATGALLGSGPAGQTGLAASINRLTVAPVFVPAGTTVTAVWWAQTAAGAAGALVRPVIYSCDPTYFYPAALLLDVGQQAADGANGAKSVNITAIPFQVDTIVFTGAVTQTATATFRPSAGAANVPLFGVPQGWFQDPTAQANGAGFRHDAVTGAPPATFNVPSYSVAGTTATGAQVWVGLQAQ